MQFSLPERDIPSAIPERLDLFVIGDVHGRSGALRECLQSISNKISGHGNVSTIVFLGDLIDRGPDSVGACHSALAAGDIADVVYFLPGNHELMLLEVLDGVSPEQWLRNGGSTVMSEIAPDQELKHGDCSEILEACFPLEYLDRVRVAPSHLTFGDLILVHAGLHPHEHPDKHLDRSRPFFGDEHWSTIRYPFLDWRGGWDHDGRQYRLGKKSVVHGHTPAVREDLLANPDALRACDGIDDYRAVCLDVGASSRDQVGWAHFCTKDGQTMMQIHASAPRSVD